MILGILMSNEVKIAVLETQVERLLEKQKELTERVRANEKVVAAIGLLGSIAVAFIGAGYFAPSAEACSPPRDGSEFTCPPWDDDIAVCLSLDCPRKPLPQPSGITDQVFEDDLDPDAFHRGQTVTLFDTREEIAHMGHSFPTDQWIQKIRDHESKVNRTPIEDMINNTLTEYEYGSDDTTEQEELLQLPSNGD